MNPVSLALYRIFSIYLAAEGMSGLLEIFSANASITPDIDYSIPPALYFAQLLPILIAILLWMYSPNLAKSEGEGQSLSAESAMAIGTFLLGLFLVGNCLPQAIVEYSHYKQLISVGQLGNVFANPQLLSFKVLVGKVIAGFIFILLSLKVSHIYRVIRGYGS